MARQRSREAHERVLSAALDLFGQRGIESTSMDAIAQASGVSKATIYNHWPNKEVLLLDVMAMVSGPDPEDPNSGDIRRDLAAVLGRKPPDQFGAARDRMMPALISYSAVHREFGEAWRHRVLEPSRQCLKRILRRGIQEKLLPASLDLDSSMAMLLGPLLYFRIFPTAAPPANFARNVAEAFLRAHAISRESGKTRARRGRPAA